jgi:hypothetical protein
VSVRVLLTLAWLKHALGASDEDICQRFRPDLAVMYAWGLRDYQSNPSQAPFVLPETLGEFRGRLDAALVDELIARQAAAAMDEGLVSPAHRVIDTFPCEPGSPRVPDATTRYKAHKTRWGSSQTSRRHAADVPPSSRVKPRHSNRS